MTNLDNKRHFTTHAETDADKLSRRLIVEVQREQSTFNLSGSLKMTYLWAAVQNLPFSGLLILFVDNIRYSAICKSLCSRQNNIDFEHS